MSGHTPGPWAFREWLSDNPEQLRAIGMEPVQNVSNDGGRYVMGGADGRRVALVDCRTEFKRGKGHATVCAERDANASLIAAAPDLLAALKEAERLMDEADFEDEGVHDEGHQALMAARAAIAKAEGR